MDQGSWEGVIGRSILLLALVSICVMAYAFENEPTGFRGIPWGSPPEAFPELKKIADIGGWMVYTRAEDKKEVGAATLRLLHYQFYKNQFASVLIQTTGTANKKALKEAVVQQYGEGNQLDPNIDQWLWEGQKARIALKCGPPNDECSFRLSSTELLAQHDADRKK